MKDGAENTLVAKRAVDGALARLGSPPISDNPRFLEESKPGRLSYVLDEPPLRFEFGYEFEIGLGPVSEIYTVNPNDSSTLQEDIERILTSSVRVDQRNRRVTVEFVDADGTAWLRSRQRSLFGSYEPNNRLKASYPPAFMGRSRTS